MNRVHHADQKILYSKQGVIRVLIAVGHHVQLPSKNNKCPKCGIEVKDKHFIFAEIPKKYFCSSCWYKIYTVWKAQKYIFEDPDVWYWTGEINNIINKKNDKSLS